jgi:SNF2 family DNA or RNA helicase
MPETKTILDVLEPLNPTTAKLLKKMHFASNDRIRLSLNTNGRRFIARVFAAGTEVGEEWLASWNCRRAFFERFPERRLLNQHDWEIGCTDISALILHACFPADQLEFLDEETELRYRYLVARLTSQTLNGIRKAEFQIDGKIQDAPADFFDHPEFPLAEYQRAALFSSLCQESTALFMEQGTGKTPVAIRRICMKAHRHFLKTGKPYRALIIVPKNLRYNWQSEFEKFATVPGRTCAIRGTKLHRLKLLVEAFASLEKHEEFVAVVASYENIYTSWDAFQMIPWNLGVLDESHFIKSAKTKRAKFALEIRDRCDERLILTGTPITNHLGDLWCQLEFLGEGLSGFTTYEAFRRFYMKFEKVEGRYGYERFVGLQHVPFLQERLNRLAFMIDKKTALPDLPDKVYDSREIEMVPDQRALYKEVQATLMVEIQAVLDSSTLDDTMTVNNILTKLLRLAQITSGFYKTDPVYADNGDVVKVGNVRHFSVNPKLEELMEILKESPDDQKVIVWACFVQDITNISCALVEAEIPHVMYYGATTESERIQAEKRFNEDPNCKVFIGNPIVGGQGLNLLGHTTEVDTGKDCSLVIYYSQNWSMTARTQSEDRAHRIGTRTHVQYTDLVCPGTIDDEIRQRVLGKRVHAKDIQDIRDVMTHVLKIVSTEDN